MLEGREPEIIDDWVRIVNFVACNTAYGMEEVVCKLFKRLYAIPVEDSDVSAIAKFQKDLKPCQ